MLNIFKLGKYVVAWSLPLAQTSNTKTHLHKRSRQTIQGHLKKQPANVLMYKNWPLFYVRFQTVVDSENFWFRKSVYSTYEFFHVCEIIFTICSRMICIYICNLFTGDQVPRNSIHPHWSDNEWGRNHTWTLEKC